MRAATTAPMIRDRSTVQPMVVSAVAMMEAKEVVREVVIDPEEDVVAVHMVEVAVAVGLGVEVVVDIMVEE